MTCTALSPATTRATGLRVSALRYIDVTERVSYVAGQARVQGESHYPDGHRMPADLGQRPRSAGILILSMVVDRSLWPVLPAGDAAWSSTYEGRQVRYTLADAHLQRALIELVKVALAVDTAEPCLNDDLPMTRAVGW